MISQGMVDLVAYKTNRTLAGEVVGKLGLYTDCGGGSPYSIRLNGKFMASDDTADLADRVSDYFTRQELKEALDNGS